MFDNVVKPAAPKILLLDIETAPNIGYFWGLLCFLCNKRLIGRRRREHAQLFTKAAEYLESDAAQHLLEEKNV